MNYWRRSSQTGRTATVTKPLSSIPPPRPRHRAVESRVHGPARLERLAREAERQAVLRSGLQPWSGNAPQVGRQDDEASARASQRSSLTTATLRPAVRSIRNQPTLRD